jgi:hypothetical protein
MSSATLPIEGGSDRPKAIKHYLDLIDRRDYESVAEVMTDAYVEYDLTHPDHEDREISNKNMTGTLAKLGLVEVDHRQTLTPLGRQLVDVILYHEDCFYDLLHLLYSTAYYRDPDPERAISWSYCQISRFYREHSPTDFDAARQDAVETVTQRAENSGDANLQNHGPLSKRSLNGYRRFVERLDPPVFDEEGDGDEFVLRSFAEKPLVLGAIDALYRSDHLFQALNYGDLLELSNRAADLLGAIVLVGEEDLTDVIEHAASMDGRVDVEADYSLRVRLNEPVEFDELA